MTELLRDGEHGSPEAGRVVVSSGELEAVVCDHFAVAIGALREQDEGGSVMLDEDHTTGLLTVHSSPSTFRHPHRYSRPSEAKNRLSVGLEIHQSLTAVECRAKMTITNIPRDVVDLGDVLRHIPRLVPAKRYRSECMSGAESQGDRRCISVS